MSALLQVQGCENGLYLVTWRCAVDLILRHDLRDGIPFSRESIQYERTGNSDQQVSALGYFGGAQRFISPHGSRRELEEPEPRFQSYVQRRYWMRVGTASLG